MPDGIVKFNGFAVFQMSWPWVREIFRRWRSLIEHLHSGFLCKPNPFGFCRCSGHHTGYRFDLMMSGGFWIGSSEIMGFQKKFYFNSKPLVFKKSNSNILNSVIANEVSSVGGATFWLKVQHIKSLNAEIRKFG